MFRMMFALLLAVLLPFAAIAQNTAEEKPPYPAFYSGLTNDFANILSDEAEARINAELQAARDSRGLEMAVVTIRSREDYAPSTGIAQFAARLFNGWGIGRPDINDGILLLVAIEDREMRIALGSGYPDYGVWFCPRDEHVTVKGFRKMFSRHTACTNCTYHTRETTRHVVTPASTVSMGIAQLDHSCKNCGHEVSEKVSIPKVQTNSSGSGRRSSGISSSSSSGGFSGGRSSGGGASGSW